MSKKNDNKIEVSTGGITISDLMDFKKIKLEPSQTWTFKDERKNINVEFSTGLLGKNGFQLLEVISNIFAKLENEREKIPFEDDDGNKDFAPWYGDHSFLEILFIDFETKIMTAFFGS